MGEAQLIQIGGRDDDAGEGRFYEGDEEPLEFPMEDDSGGDIAVDNATSVELRVYDAPLYDSDKSSVFSASKGDFTFKDDDGNGTNETAVYTTSSADTSGVVSSGDDYTILYGELWIEDDDNEEQTMYEIVWRVETSEKA